MNKKLKIAYFLDNFYPQVNGVVTSSVNTAFEMSKRGHSVYGVVPFVKKDPNYPVDYFPFPTYFQQGFEASFYPDFIFTNPFSSKIVKAMKEFQPDIIHFHAPFTIGYQAIKIAEMLGVPVVGTFHTFFAEPEYLKVIGMEHSKLLYNIGWWYSNQFFNKCDMVISPSKATAEYLLAHDLKTPLTVVSNGAEVFKYQNFNFAYNFPVNIQQDDDWLLFIGRISEEKCLWVLFDAMKIIFSKRSNVKLLIVGGGPTLEKTKKLIKEQNLSDKIVFTGMVTNKLLLESGVLKKMKLFVTPSTSENQPMTIIESIMFGLPIVGTNAKGVPEMIEDNGFIVPPNDPKAMAEKIMLILENKEVHDRLSKKSLELSQKYDIKNTSDKMEKVYYSLLK
ncbi:MAG: hypothetical protein A2086_04800 [Spirochaetes bacterium GWD1_27_9]|nr:MAG: hypothetical protein A2Z98_04215 [Spirochaetes bacterium GWB1_27_13]OHD27624.1 MAG: hypothetical protein A2Y34_00255 [Spirochaetes bacterium GWC1_27_15]OHD34580.1 MAG: hypothetical protein A2086_04800 [Spirochaetes bacterium GWD1_27_9]